MTKEVIGDDSIRLADQTRRGSVAKFAACKRLWAEMLNNRELIQVLIWRDVSVRYRQSALGYFWAVLPQLLTVSIFSFLVGQRALPIGVTPIPYPAYAIWSMTLWWLFAGTVSACTGSLVQAGALVTRINFPKEAVVVAAIGQPLFDFIVRLAPVIAVFLWLGVIPPVTAWFVVVLVIPLVLMAIGFGFVFAIGNLVFRDVANIVGIAATFGMFATPVLYPPPVSWPLRLVNVLNPFSPILKATQDLLVYGEIKEPLALSIACFFSAAVFLLGWKIFRVTLPRIIERA